MKKFKISDIVLISVIAIVLVGGILYSVFSGNSKSETKKYDVPVALTGTAGLQEITYAEYNNLLESKDPFIIIVERTTCGYCQQYLPIAKEVSEAKKVPMYYIDMDKLSTEENTKLSTSNSYLKSNDWGTPTTLLLVGEDTVDSISGYVEATELEKWLDTNVKVESE